MRLINIKIQLLNNVLTVSIVCIIVFNDKYSDSENEII